MLSIHYRTVCTCNFVLRLHRLATRPTDTCLALEHCIHIHKCMYVYTYVRDQSNNVAHCLQKGIGVTTSSEEEEEEEKKRKEDEEEEEETHDLKRKNMQFSEVLFAN